jgi:hypothetical protein
VGPVVRNVAAYITRIFQTFGLIFNDMLGFVAAEDDAGAGSNTVVVNKSCNPYWTRYGIPVGGSRQGAQ